MQKQVGLGFVAQAAYVGTREVRKIGYLDINAGQVIGLGAAGRPLNQRFGRAAGTTFIQPVGTGRYDALQTSLERRFSGGLQLSFNYTWSKAVGPTDHSTSRPQVQATAYFAKNWAVRGFDRTHVANFNSIWELPFGKGRRWATQGPLAFVVGGWQVNNLLSSMTGKPFSITAPGATLDMPGSTQTADQVKSTVTKPGGIGSGSPWFDPNAFQAPPQGRFGNSGFHTVRGPGLVNWDFGVFREFAVTERWRLSSAWSRSTFPTRLTLTTLTANWGTPPSRRSPA